MYSTNMYPVSSPYRCRLCGTASYRRLIHRGPDGAMQYSGLFRCSGCSVTFSDHVASREEKIADALLRHEPAHRGSLSCQSHRSTADRNLLIANAVRPAEVGRLCWALSDSTPYPPYLGGYTSETQTGKFSQRKTLTHLCGSIFTRRPTMKSLSFIPCMLLGLSLGSNVAQAVPVEVSFAGAITSGYGTGATFAPVSTAFFGSFTYESSTLPSNFGGNFAVYRSGVITNASITVGSSSFSLGSFAFTPGDAGPEIDIVNDQSDLFGAYFGAAGSSAPGRVFSFGVAAVDSTGTALSSTSLATADVGAFAPTTSASCNGCAPFFLTIADNGDQTGNAVGDFTRFSVLTPVPEPSSVALLVGGGLLLVSRVRRRKSAVKLGQD